MHRKLTDDVSRELRIEHLLDVRSDLDVVATASCAEIINTGNLRSESTRRCQQNRRVVWIYRVFKLN